MATAALKINLVIIATTVQNADFRGLVSLQQSERINQSINQSIKKAIKADYTIV